MGAMQSSVPPEVAVVGALVAGSVTAYGLYARNTNADSAGAGSSSKKAQPSAPGSKKPNKKKGASSGFGDAEFEKIIAAANKENQTAVASKVRVVPFPEVVPGAFEAGATSAGDAEAKEKKARKKKGKKSTPASTTSSTALPSTLPTHTAPEESIVHVPSVAPTDPARKAPGSSVAGTPVGTASGSKSKSDSPSTAPPATTSAGPSISASQGLTQSLTFSDAPDDVSWTRVSTRKRAVPVTEPSNTEDEESVQELEAQKRKTFAERMLPRPRKTGVEDMEDEPLQPTLARVIRVKPTPSEKPADGFSWGDYEEYARADDGTSADGDADDVWEEVKSKKRNKPDRGSALSSSADSLPAGQRSTTTPEALTKRQRQNIERREAATVDKQAQERERLDRLERHRRELERTRIAEQFSGGKKVSGGMQASVGESGKLVWD
ncbi:hypothetical protein DFH11DRAFT_1729801 [Phellopilus nigrolimitatus]|nr:hypothetical protein DFH11DRAFT_1729801 [Phellopilus nigrolimitatus]